jgi:hypothetical protein
VIPAALCNSACCSAVKSPEPEEAAKTGDNGNDAMLRAIVNPHNVFVRLIIGRLQSFYSAFAIYG